MIRVSGLTVYPIKSAAGVDVDVMPLDGHGATGDRRWLVVDLQGQAITARTHHPLVTVRPTFADDARAGALTLQAPSMSPVHVAVPDDHAARRQVTVWDDTLTALDAGHEAADWFSALLGTACRLVRLDPLARRPLHAKYAGPISTDSRRVAFTDGAPLLLLGMPAITQLTDHLLAVGETQPMDRRRFRANIWLEGLDPHEEDTWSRVRIGEVDIGVGTWCPRCVFTTVDPDTAEGGLEPMRMLARYRLSDGKVVFGVNATHAAPGTIRRGDPVTVLARR